MASSEAVRQRLESANTWFRGLAPGKRENLIKAVVIGGGVVVLVAAYYFTGRDTKVAPKPKDKVAVIELGDSRLEDDIRAQVERERQEQRNQNQKQDQTIEGQREQLDAQAKQLEVMQSVLQALQGGNLALPTAGEIQASAEAQTQVPQRAADWERGLGLTGAPAQSGGGRASDAGLPGSANDPAMLAVTFVGDIGVAPGGAPPGVKAPAAGSGAAADADAKKKRKFFLPVSFMPAKLLTGLRAKTVDSAKEDPEPILLRVQAPAILPNEVRAALDGCFVVAHGYGSLASHRVEARLVSLSCVDYEGRSIIEQEILGVVEDEDGVKGLNARPVSKMGANMARLLLAGLVQGSAQAFQQTAVTTSISPLGQTQSIDTDKLATAGLGRGVSNAAGELAKIYADLARQSAPVLEVGPSKDVSIFITQGVWLEVKEYEQ